jgi:hypothetical protein
MALSCCQRVCDLAIWMQDCLLTLLWPCSYSQEYVILLFDARLPADPLTALSCSQEVCDLAIWIPDCLLTLTGLVLLSESM